MKKQLNSAFEDSFLYKFISKNVTSFKIKFFIAFSAFVFFSKLLITINHIDIRNESPIRMKEINRHTSHSSKANYEDILGNESKIQAREQLNRYIHKWFLHPPSQLPYNLFEDKQGLDYNSYKWSSPSYLFINSVIMDIFKRRPPGFFVEAGALDGEHLSNTLLLERKFNWTGLLVEGDRNSYSKLRRKNRKSWSSPLCLATKPYPHEVVFTAFEKKNYLRGGGNGAARILQNDSLYSLDGPGYTSFSKALCIPAGDLLGALNVTHIDFFSLDVEGVEMDVLKNFPFDQISVDVWAIEHANSNDPGPGSNNEKFFYISKDHNYRYEDSSLVTFMENKGYYLFDMFCQVIPDYIFVRKESTLFSEFAVPKTMEKRKNICLTSHYDPSKMPADPEHLRDKRHWPTLKINL